MSSAFGELKCLCVCMCVYGKLERGEAILSFIALLRIFLEYIFVFANLFCFPCERAKCVIFSALLKGRPCSFKKKIIDLASHAFHRAE